jgi:hypothetical protein
MPSLLTWGDREEFRVPLTITQTVSIGKPDITPLSTARLLCRFAMSDSIHWNESLKKPGRPAGTRTWNVADNSLKHKSIPKEHAKNFIEQQPMQRTQACDHQSGQLPSEMLKTHGLDLAGVGDSLQY